MSNRKATFAKRQRESDLKDHAKAKDARRLERQNAPKTSKGPEIAWDQQVYPTDSGPEGSTASTVPTDDTAADVAPRPVPPPPSQNPNQPANQNPASGGSAPAKPNE